jgi:chaperonin GroES
MKITPLFDRVVVEPAEAEETTKSGIVLLAKDQEKPQMAKVVAVGPGGMVNGKEVKMEVKAGDTVLFAPFAGDKFKIDGKEVTILSQSDILAIVK